MLQTPVTCAPDAWQECRDAAQVPTAGKRAAGWARLAAHSTEPLQRGDAAQRNGGGLLEGQGDRAGRLAAGTADAPKAATPATPSAMV